VEKREKELFTARFNKSYRERAPPLAGSISNAHARAISFPSPSLAAAEFSYSSTAFVFVRSVRLALQMHQCMPTLSIRQFAFVPGEFLSLSLFVSLVLLLSFPLVISPEFQSWRYFPGDERLVLPLLRALVLRVLRDKHPLSRDRHS